MRFLAGALTLLCWLGAPVAAQDGACRIALALGLDVSGSVDDEEYRLQLDGLAAALLTPEVQEALLAVPQAPAELAIFEWSGLNQHRLLVDWTKIDDAGKLRAISSRLRGTFASYTDPSTAIGAAMAYGAGLLEQRQNCWQRTLDLSGDGPANTGPDPGLIPEAVTGGITINGLVVVPTARANTTKNLRNVKTLLEYYQAQVIRGPGAFVEVAQDFDDFERAMTRKLIRELAGLTVSQAPPNIAPDGVSLPQ
ncbi:DUF1194 domain-containing protein [uncultured Roseovarius sp.]|uniref:DUF1194 domain-containing protein n=1 Tax=uncultured Roseovarius sp. TaxID=293344 RepID=UPI00260ADD69|nr:DUF1194 domain-containing protein [uncultured Roseovarius sp.]